MTVPLSAIFIPSTKDHPLAEESRRSAPRTALRWLGKTLAAAGVVLLALVVGVVCFVLFPPADLLRRGALPLVRGALNHQRLHIGHLALRPLEGLELKGLWLGAPAGYERPLLDVRRIVIRWDLSGILDQRIRVLQLQVERPLLRLEKRKGKLSWVAFLDNMPKSEDKPPEEPGEPTKIQVLLDRVSIIGLGAAVDDGQRQIALDSLHVALHGLWSATKSDLHLALRLEPRTPGKHNLALAQQAAPVVAADLATTLDLDLRVQQVHAPRGSVDLSLAVGSRRLKAPWKLAPVKLGLAISATGDLPKEEARVQRMELTFNGDELLRLRGALTGLASSRDLDVLLTRLHLPLDRLAPYARAFVQGVDFGGTLEVKGLRAAGSLASLSKRLPRLSGVVSAKKIWADVTTDPKKKPMKIKDLDLRLHLASAGPGEKTAATHRQLRALLPALDALPSPGEEEGVKGKGKEGQGQGQGQGPGQRLPVGLKGWITLGSFTGFGARLGGLDLRLAAGARLDGFKPLDAAARVRLWVPRVSYRSRATGRVTTSLRTILDASGDLRSGEVSLDRLALAAANRLVRLHASGQAKGWGKDELAANVRLAPVDLARLWAWLPAKLKAPMPTLKLRGKLGLNLRAAGRLPASGTPPLRTPVKVDARLSLNGVAISDRKLKLGLVGLSGALEIKGRPTDLRLATRRLCLAAFNKPDQQLSVLGITLPLTARITPRGLTARVGLKTNQVEMKKIRLATRGLHLKLNLRSALPVHRLILGRSGRLGKTRLELATGFDSFRMNAPQNRIAVGKERTRIHVDYAPGSDTVLDFATNISSFRHAKQRIAVRGITMTFKDRSAGLGAVVLPKPKLRLWGLDARHSLTLGIKHLDYGALGLKVSNVALEQKGSGKNFRLHKDGRVDLDHVWAKIGLGVGSISYRGLIKRPLRNNRVELDLSATGLNPIPSSFKLRRLKVSLPSRGLRLSGQGRAGRVFPFSATNLPDFDVTVSAGVKNPRGGRGKATFLWPNIHGSGSAGVSARLRRTARDRVRLGGRLRASAFNLWTEKKGPSPSRLHLADIDANVPVAQEVVLLGGRGWALPKLKPKKLISDRGASVLYDTMRPYRKGRASFSMGGLTMAQQLGATRRVVKLDRLALDLAIRDNALLLSRMYIKLFGGDIVGAVQLQARSLVPLDPILLAKTQITGMRLSHLDPKATTHSKETEVSAMLDLAYQPRPAKLEGRVNITRISLKMLDSLLVAIDPAGTNISVQKNRKFLKAWYTKLADPRVKLVSIWISHGNLNMDIRLDAWFVVGTILKKIVKDMRIRRVNILPMLRQYAGPFWRNMGRVMVKTTGRK